MNPHTGEVVRLNVDELPPPGWLQVIGSEEEVATLSANVRRGAAEAERRRARKAMQKASRRLNR